MEFNFSDKAEFVLPACYNQKMRQDLDSGAVSVPLAKHNPYFYLLGAKLLEMIVDDSLSATLINVRCFAYFAVISNKTWFDC